MPARSTGKVFGPCFLRLPFVFDFARAFECVHRSPSSDSAVFQIGFKPDSYGWIDGCSAGRMAGCYRL